jgi:hypothetical protein
MILKATFWDDQKIIPNIIRALLVAIRTVNMKKPLP